MAVFGKNRWHDAHQVPRQKIEKDPLSLPKAKATYLLWYNMQGAVKQTEKGSHHNKEVDPTQGSIDRRSLTLFNNISSYPKLWPS